MNKLLPLLLVPLLGACAPTTVAPTVVTTTARYSVKVTAGEDNPVLAAVVAAAPLAPLSRGRQPWKAEEIDRSQVVLRSRATAVNTGTFGSFMSSLPQEMTFNVIAYDGATTLTATYSSAYAPTAQAIFDQLDRRFPRLK